MRHFKYSIGVFLVGVLFLIASCVTEAEATHEVGDFEVSGIASNYSCTAGWCDGTPTVALPQALGGRYDSTTHGYVEVCGTRCAVLPVVDYCQCYWGTADERIIDLSHSAWALVTDEPLSTGLIDVRVTSVGDQRDDSGGGSGPQVVPSPGIREGASSNTLPNTALSFGR